MSRAPPLNTYSMAATAMAGAGGRSLTSRSASVGFIAAAVLAETHFKPSGRTRWCGCSLIALTRSSGSRGGNVTTVARTNVSRGHRPVHCSPPHPRQVGDVAKATLLGFQRQRHSQISALSLSARLFWAELDGFPPFCWNQHYYSLLQQNLVKWHFLYLKCV